MDTGFLAGLASTAVLLAGLILLVRSEQRQLRLRQEGSRKTWDADELRARLKEMAEPSLVLAPAWEFGFSKLGGDPELPAIVPWPRDGGVPLTFLAQIDLAEARASGGPAWLPLEGQIFVFYDPEGHGGPDVVRAIYHRDPWGSPGTSPLRARLRFPEQRVRFARVISAPSLAWLGLADHRLKDHHPKAWKEIADLVTAPPGDQIQHRIGGYPNEIQDGQMALVCERAFRGLWDPAHQTNGTTEMQQAVDAWRLLIQIDSDSTLKMNWGDGGRLYIFVRKTDAVAGDFSKTVGIWQSY